ncbi:MAG TPA: hypothetical protein VMV89_13375, partial [Candidatus Paceibacterota bacterium]|nr:hypothetical protein [Candidatus Paceibacterota bacterium]
MKPPFHILRWPVRPALLTLLIPAVSAAGADPSGTAVPHLAPALNPPLAFESNCGQSKSPAQFLARGDGYCLSLNPAVCAMALRPKGEAGGRPAVLTMTLAGARADAEASALEPLPGRVNYFIGNDPAQWRRGIPTFAKVKFRSVYSGIDLLYYGNESRLEYDFRLAPGADAGRI